MIRYIRSYLLGLICLSAITTPAQAQLADKLVPHFGFSYEFITLKPKYSTGNSILSYYGISGGVNYVLTHSNDMFSLGVNPNATVCFSFTSYGGTSLMLQGPVYLLGRVGAAATPYNESRFGIGAGIGAKFTYLNQNDGLSYYFKEKWMNPSAVVEANINSRFSAYTIRFSWSLMRPVRTYDNVDYEWGSTGLAILYQF